MWVLGIQLRLLKEAGSASMELSSLTLKIGSHTAAQAELEPLIFLPVTQVLRLKARAPSLLH